MASNNIGGESAGMGEAADAVEYILDFVLEITFVYLRPGFDLEPPRVFRSKIPVICRKEALTITITDGSLESRPRRDRRGPVSWSAFNTFLRLRSGCSDLRDILLVTTPVEWPNREPGALRVHCYRLDSRTHRGATTVPREEFRRIECHYGPDAFPVVRCTRFIDLVDAVSNTLLTGQIFDVIAEGSRTVRATWYKGRAMRLTYQGDGTVGQAVGPASRKPSDIRSLNQPKIPVRLTCRLGSLLKKAPGVQVKNSLPRIKTAAWRREQKLRVQKRTPSSRLKKPLRTRSFELLPQSRPGMLRTEEEAGADCLIFCDCGHVLGRPLGPRAPNQLPPVLPVRFSNAAFCYLEEKLRWPLASGALVKLRLLVQLINARQRPLLKHLMCFFCLAEDLRFKIYIRREVGLPGRTQHQGRRYTMDCYVFDDRRDYIVSIALMDTQLHALARLFPGARQNFRFVDSAFALTPVPETVCKWLESTLDAFSARRWYKYLGELALGQARPQMGLLELPDQG